MPMDKKMEQRIWGEAYLVCSLVTLFYSTYLILKFRRNYSDYPAVFSKRFPRLLLALVVAMVVSSFVAGPINVWGHMTNTKVFLLGASVALNQFFMATIYMVFAMVWMVRFEIKIAQFSTHKKWKMYLDADWGKQCWFVENRTSLGRLIIVLKHVGVVWFLFAAPYVTLYLLGYHPVAKIILLVQILPPIALGIYVWRDTPEVGDFFHIRDQVKWLVRCTLAESLIYICLLMWSRPEHSSFLFGLLFSFMSPLFLNILLQYPVRLFLNDRESGTNIINSISSSKRPSTLDSIKSGGPPLRRRSSLGRQLMRDIIGNIVTFECFMAHLMREFSFENLLFIVEVTQFKKYVLAKFPELKKTPGLNHGLVVPLPDEIPKSVVIHDDAQSVRVKAQYLYDKYVDAAAILEVNIAYETRVNLANVFSETLRDDSRESLVSSPRSSMETPRSPLGPTLQPRTSSEMSGADMMRVDSESRSNTVGKKEASLSELYSAFDDAYKQIMTLLLDSFSRFHHENETDCTA